MRIAKLQSPETLDVALGLVLAGVVIGAAGIWIDSKYFSLHAARVLAEPSTWFLLLALAVAVSAVIRPSVVAVLGTIVLVAFFLRDVEADISAIAGLVNILAVLAIGDLLRSAIRFAFRSGKGVWPKDDDTRFYQALLYGIVGQVLIAHLLSVVAQYTPGNVRAVDQIAIAVWVLMLVLRRPSVPFFSPPNGKAVLGAIRKLGPWMPLIVVAAFAFARARVLPYSDMDTIWYGLSIERTLAPGGAVWNPPMLGNLVYYYGKLPEIIQFASSDLPEYAFQVSVNVWFIVLTAFVLGRELSRAGLPASMATMLAVVTMSTPAIMHVAAGTKGDMLGALAFTLGLAFLARYGRQPHPVHLANAIVALCIVVSAKLIQAIFVAAPLTFLVVTIGLAGWRRRSGWGVAVALTAVAVLSALLICLRTYLLTGILFVGPAEIVDLQRSLGLTPTELPIVYELNFSAHAQNSAAPMRVFDILFRPFEMPHVSITWTSWTPPLLAVAGAYVVAGDRLRATLAANVPMLITTLPVVILTVIVFLFADFFIYGGDGNYYILLILALAGIIFVLPKRTGIAWKATATLLSAGIIVVNLGLAMSATWGVGIGKVDWSYSGDGINTPLVREWWLKRIGLGEISARLGSEVSCSLVTNRINIEFRKWLLQLPCKVEMFEIGGGWQVRGRKRPTLDKEAARAYLCAFRPRFILDGPQEERELAGPRKEVEDSAENGDDPIILSRSFPAAIKRLMASGNWSLYEFYPSRLCFRPHDSRAVSSDG